jgi:hypothetical protein
MQTLKYFKWLQLVMVVFCVTLPWVLRYWDRNTNFYPLDIQGVPERVMGDADLKVIVNTDKPMILEVSPTSKVHTLDKVEKDQYGFRSSLSDYARSSESYIFGVLYGIAGSLFIYNGIFFYSNRSTFNGALLFNPKGTWYNIIIGILLIAVVFLPHYKYNCLHVLVSILFILSNVLVLVFFPNPHEGKTGRRLRWIMAAVIVMAFLLSQLNNSPVHPSILDAEWISLGLIAIHLLIVVFSLPDQDKITFAVGIPHKK